MSYPVSVFISYFDDLPVEQAISLLSQAGFTYGELSIDHLNHPNPQALRTYIDDLGFTIPQGHTSFHLGLCSQEGVDLIKRDLEMFQVLGITKAVVHAAGGKNLPDEERYARWVKYLGELSDFVDGTGITLCLENLFSNPLVNSADKLLQLIADAGDKNMAICLDTGHLHLSNTNSGLEQSQGEFIRKAGDKLQALHIVDNDGLGDTHQMPYSARKGVDWVDVMQALRDIDYKGLFNLECLAERRPPMPVKMAKLRFMLEMCRYMVSDEFLR